MKVLRNFRKLKLMPKLIIIRKVLIPLFNASHFAKHVRLIKIQTIPFWILKKTIHANEQSIHPANNHKYKNLVKKE